MPFCLFIRSAEPLLQHGWFGYQVHSVLYFYCINVRHSESTVLSQCIEIKDNCSPKCFFFNCTNLFINETPLLLILAGCVGLPAMNVIDSIMVAHTVMHKASNKVMGSLPMQCMRKICKLLCINPNA